MQCYQNNGSQQVKTILCLAVLTVTLSFCKKKLPESCYEKSYENSHKNDACITNCPGVIGCDKKTYCNECEMHRMGIKETK